MNMAPPITRISPDISLADLHKFDTIIDVRSPAEFVDDHIPGAINLPVLNDQQRAEIGTIYKQINPFTAKRAGAALVAQNIAAHLQNSLQDKARDWRPLIYCWRGGQRSGAMAQIFSNIGWHSSVIDGGYKSYRRHVLDCLDHLPKQLSLMIVSGQTGTAKTHILRAASAKGAAIIDLERLACHRGSLLGGEPGQPQPTQRYFESQLCQALQQSAPGQTILIEAESNKIGNIHVPPAFWAAMRNAPTIRVTAPIDARVNFLQRDYAHMINQPEFIMPLLSKLTHRHSAKQLATWKDMIDRKDWPDFIKSLLETHYDPSYQRSGSARLARETGVVAATTLDHDDINRLAEAIMSKSASIATNKPAADSFKSDL
jgi:tRNA 2-selenouridine synthase